jgi:hypothetical protein
VGNVTAGGGGGLPCIGAGAAGRGKGEWRPFLIASMTCGGRGLPFLAALIVAAGSWPDHVGLAASTTLATCGRNASPLRFRVASVYCPTPSALRHRSGLTRRLENLSTGPAVTAGHTDGASAPGACQEAPRLLVVGGDAPVGRTDVEARTSQARWVALLAATAVALYGCWLLLRPFLDVLTGAVVLVVTFYPAHRRLAAWTGRPAASALASTAAVVLIVLVPVALVAFAVAREVPQLAAGAQEAAEALLDPGSPAAEGLRRLGVAPADVERLRKDPALAEVLQDLGGEAARRAGGGRGRRLGGRAGPFRHLHDLLPLPRRRGAGLLAGRRPPHGPGAGPGDPPPDARDDRRQRLRGGRPGGAAGRAGGTGVLGAGPAQPGAVGGGDGRAIHDPRDGLVPRLGPGGGLPGGDGGVGQGPGSRGLGRAGHRHGGQLPAAEGHGPQGPDARAFAVLLGARRAVGSARRGSCSGRSWSRSRSA